MTNRLKIKFNIIVTALVTLVLVSCYMSFVFANNTTNTENATNTVVDNNPLLGEKLEKASKGRQDAEDKLEYVQTELGKAVIDLQAVDDKIRETEAEIDKIENEIKEIEDKIKLKEKNVKEIEEQYLEEQKLLEERIVVMYEKGNTTYLDILLDSQNLIDFVLNYYTLTELIQSDTELLDNIQNEKRKVQNAKDELDEERAKTEDLKEQEQEQYIILENDRVKLADYKNNLTTEEKELADKIEQYKNEEQRLAIIISLASKIEYDGGPYDGTGLMLWPVAKTGTVISSGFGRRVHPVYGVVRGHSGIDIANTGYGAHAIAAADGVVSLAQWYGGYGNCVMVNHGNGISTLYGHGMMIPENIKVGTVVKAGDTVLLTGMTGTATGPHLHFEVRVNGEPVNPIPFLSGELSLDTGVDNTISEDT